MEIYGNLNFLPIPVKQLESKFRKKHKVLSALKKISSDYADNNNEGIKNLMTYFNKKFNSDLGEITIEEERNFKKELLKIDKSFAIVFQEFKTLEWNEQKDIYVKFYNDIRKGYLSIIDNMFNEYTDRTNITSKEILFYNYTELLANRYSDIIYLLQTSKKTNFERNLALSSYSLLYFSIPVYNYINENITEDELLNKLAKIAIVTTPYEHKVHRNVDKLLDIASKQSPY